MVGLRWRASGSAYVCRSHHLVLCLGVPLSHNHLVPVTPVLALESLGWLCVLDVRRDWIQLPWCTHTESFSSALVFHFSRSPLHHQQLFWCHGRWLQLAKTICHCVAAVYEIMWKIKTFPWTVDKILYTKALISTSNVSDLLIAKVDLTKTVSLV